jgi:cysteine desulfurase
MPDFPIYFTYNPTNQMRRIYLDYASLTPVDRGVMKQMKKYSTGDYTNPMAYYASAVNAKGAIDDAKERIAKVLHAHSDEIIFTSGGTESNNLVLQNKINRHIIISAIEHSSIINPIQATHISVDGNGMIDLDLLKRSITPETTLVSIMLVNNEIGTIEPLTEIAKIVREARKTYGGQFPLLHTDACQAIAHIPIYVEKLGVDLISLDGHKVYGPRGIGMLYVRRGTLDIERAGTANVPGIMGLAYAIELNEKMRERETVRIAQLKEYFVNELIRIEPGIRINGDLDHFSPHILNVSIPNIDNEFFVLQLDARGVECSTKSACLKDEDESYVLKEIGANSKSSIRFSFGRNTTKGELNTTLKAITQILQK